MHNKISIDPYTIARFIYTHIDYNLPDIEKQIKFYFSLFCFSYLLINDLNFECGENN